MIELLADFLLAGLILLALYGIGRGACRFIRFTFWTPAAEVAYSFGFGLGITATLLFALAVVGLLVPVACWLILGLGIAFALIQWPLMREDINVLWVTIRGVIAESIFARAMLIIGMIFVLLNLVGDLAPPLEGDTVHQYLLTAREWSLAGRYFQPSHIWASTLPGNMMMISAWSLVLRPSYSLPTLVAGLGFSLFFALAVYSLARQHLNPAPAMFAAIVAYTMPDVGYLAQSAKVDMGWAFFETLTLAAVFHWMYLTDQSAEHRNSAWKWLILAGICLGWAVGSKNQALISIVLLGAWIMLRMALHKSWTKTLKAGAIFGGSVILSGFPYYLYNGIVHHNPFYPVAADLFARWFSGTISPRSELGTEIFYPWTIGGYLTNLWNMSLGHGPKFYLGFIIGPIFLLIIPIGILFGWLHGQRVLWKMLIYAFIFSIVWFLVKQAARHFLPGLVLLSVISGFLLWKLEQSSIRTKRFLMGAALICLIGNLAVWLGVFYWSRVYRVAFGLETRLEYLQRIHDHILPDTFPDWATITYLNNHLEPKDRVLSIHATSPLYISPQMVSGNWGDRLAYERIDDPDILLDNFKTHHINYILIYKADVSNLPLFSRQSFLAKYAELLYDEPRTQLYHLIDAEER